MLLRHSLTVRCAMSTVTFKAPPSTVKDSSWWRTQPPIQLLFSSRAAKRHCLNKHCSAVCKWRPFHWSVCETSKRHNQTVWMLYNCALVIRQYESPHFRNYTSRAATCTQVVKAVKIIYFRGLKAHHLDTAQHSAAQIRKKLKCVFVCRCFIRNLFKVIRNLDST